MNNIQQCAKCKLFLPMSCLIPVIIPVQGQRMKAFLCNHCKDEIDKERNNASN
jgi:hypothetical protein